MSLLQSVRLAKRSHVWKSFQCDDPQRPSWGTKKKIDTAAVACRHRCTVGKHLHSTTHCLASGMWWCQCHSDHRVDTCRDHIVRLRWYLCSTRLSSYKDWEILLMKLWHLCMRSQSDVCRGTRCGVLLRPDTEARVIRPVKLFDSDVDFSLLLFDIMVAY